MDNNTQNLKTLHDHNNVLLSIQVAQHSELSNQELDNAIGSTLDKFAMLGTEQEKVDKINALIERFPKMATLKINKLL